VSRTADRLLPVLAGVVLALAYPPARLLVPAFVGLAPLLVYIADRPTGTAGRWSATRGGLVTGAVYFGLQLYWLAVALFRYSALAIPACLGAVLIGAGLTGGFAWAVHYTRERLRLPLPVLAALYWTLLEWLQAHLGDLAFPWLGLGTSLASFPTLAGAADLVGSRGLTAWIALLNGLVATAILRNRAGRREAPALLALLVVFAIPAGYGALRTATLEMRPVARVALVQPNIPEEIKLDPRLALDSSITALTRLTAALDEPHLDLVVWPEVALPTAFLQDPGLIGLARSLSRRAGAPILTGAYGVDDGPGADRITFNSAFLVDPRDPTSLPPRYDKQRLVPFVERVPFIDPTLLASAFDESRAFGTLGRGRDRPLLESGGGEPFGVLICYESIFAPLARDDRRRGARFLVNVTNDAWFGRDAWWGRTTALWQHPAHLALRAIETRMGIARAANTGFSLFLDPLGRSYGRTDLFTPAVVSGVVYTTDATPLFVRWGDWLATALAMAALALLLGARLRPEPGGPGGAG
jgi:apolipoprotein N-acyltransferase